MVAGSEDGSSLSLEDFVGQAFGDLSDGEPETAGSTGEAAGAPPAERPAADPASVPPEGTDAPERAGTPPADAAAKPAPDASAAVPKTPEAPALPADDPLKDAKAATYTVNGEQRTYEGIRVLGTDGAIIKPEDLPDLMRRLGERDHLYETNKAQYEASQQLERLTEWRTTGEDGKETVLKGLEGLATMRVQHGKLVAAFDTLANVFKDPKQFIGLLGQDAEGKIVLDPAAMDNLLTRSDLAEERAEKAIREQLATMVRAPASTTPPDYTASAPQMIDVAAQSAGLDGKLLTEKDRTFLATQFPRYIRTVTEADRRGNATLKLGGPIVDATFTQLVKDRIEQRQEMAKTVTASTSAAAANAAKLAAAARGKTPAAPVAPAKRAPTPDTRSKDADAGFDLMENLMSGRPRSTA